ncbi:MAG: M3 family oligoendopeptidase [Thermonemataceae bacterium]|nr:M3 family oligoendopeptidase [Thermonemataceae bacterium]
MLKNRNFLPEKLEVSNWQSIETFYQNLLDRNISDAGELRAWFRDRSELESMLAEDLAWRYIRMTCNTADEVLQESFNTFVSEIQPQATQFTYLLNKKCLQISFLEDLEKQEPAFRIMLRSLRKQAEIFREENIPLQTELQIKEREYGMIAGAMTVNIDNQEITLQQAGNFLESPDRKKREEVYFAIQNRRLEDSEKLDNLLSELIQLRHQIAQNAGFKNYRDYAFAALGRFDYSPKDCFAFHEAVKTEVMPLVEELALERKQKMQLDKLKPWDLQADTEGLPALNVFENSQELIDKTIACFDDLDIFLGNCLRTMQAMKHLDLDSRKNKAPGGYNYPLAESGYPFIFMNATSNLRDLTTLLHEGGHAVHSVLCKDLEINAFKEPPAEVAELASMSMELITLLFWHHFFKDSQELQRAKKEHLEDILNVLPWIACIDKFQHWLYENPSHSHTERQSAWLGIYDEFSPKVINWENAEKFKAYHWQKQLHLYEVPFYYIEYGFAQLGAIAVWRNCQIDLKNGLKHYLDALSLGYMRSIPEIYETAQVRFEFSSSYIAELVEFVKKELNNM